DVSNPELKLRPGMTATVTIDTRKVAAVASVPNAALRFRPVKVEQGPPGSAPPPPPVFSTELKAGQARVYLPTSSPNDDPLEKVVDVGITDGRFTEIKNGVALGAEVVTEQRDAKRPEKFLGIF